MYSNSQKQYIIKQSTGKVINIFHKENTGICMSVLGKKNMWLENMPVIKDALPNFALHTDEADNIHILCQDRHGNILYWIYNNSTWNVTPILNSKNPSPYNKHLDIAYINKSMYFFYLLEYSGNRLLSFQTQKSHENLSNPKVIDYVDTSKFPFKIAQDGNNIFYIFYCFVDEKYHQLGYKKFISAKEQWSEFVPLTSYQGESEILSVIIDSKKTIHVCWQKSTPAKFELIHSFKTIESDKWEENLLYTSNSAFYDSALVVIENRMIVYWVRENSIFFCTSMDNGLKWSKPDKYIFSENRQFYCMNYKSNFPNEYDDTFFRDIPGNFSGGYKLAFVNDFSSRSDTLSPDELRVLIVSTLKTLSKNVDELKISNKDLSDKMDMLSLRQRQVELALEKAGVKTSLTDSELLKIKNEVESLKKDRKALPPVDTFEKTAENIAKESGSIIKVIDKES